MASANRHTIISSPPAPTHPDLQWGINSVPFVSDELLSDTFLLFNTPICDGDRHQTNTYFGSPVQSTKWTNRPTTASVWWPPTGRITNPRPVTHSAHPLGQPSGRSASDTQNRATHTTRIEHLKSSCPHSRNRHRSTLGICKSNAMNLLRSWSRTSTTQGPTAHGNNVEHQRS